MISEQIRFDFQSAMDAYLRYAPKLPQVEPSGIPAQTRIITNLFDISDAFDLILFDAFGVLNSGAEVIKGAREAISMLQSQGKEIMVITNDASSSHSAILERHLRRGFRFSPDKLISSQQFIAPLMRMHSKDMLWGIMAAPDWPREILPGKTVLLGTEQKVFDQVDGFVLIDANFWSHEQQQLLENSSQQRPRPILVGNPDICAPMGTYLSAEPGYFAHRASEKSGIVAEFVGKPFSHVFKEALSRYPDVDRARILMVGDTIHTDVLGGLAAGIKTLLVQEGGFLAGQDAEQQFLATGIRPHFLARAIGWGLDQ